MVKRMVLELNSAVNATLFPFDTQEMELRISPLGFADELILTESDTKSAVLATTFNHNGEWIYEATANEHLSKVLPHALKGKFSSMAQAKSVAVFRIVLRRDPTTFILSVMVPQFLIVLGAFSIFFFPTSPHYAMPRVSIGVVGCISSFAMASQIRGLTPAHSPALVDLQGESCLLMIVLAFLFNIVVENMDCAKDCKDSKERELPNMANFTARFYLILVFLAMQAFAYLAFRGAIEMKQCNASGSRDVWCWCCLWFTSKK
eukprot:TRINITY_DN14962_c0_g3_i1.p1 TRINITY_DN14962_c0_g3~~TRINITY_DN14962_c0_g3_i1.p1  ORF type:complete len:261 (-),score=39.30 TRINITY_DN14962_c0_g3_i1:72-854(-)